MSHVICVTSGGGDSISAGLMMLKEGHSVNFLNVDHGQKCAYAEKLSVEKIVSELIDRGYDAEITFVESRWLGILGGSGLTDDRIEVPDGLAGIYGSTMGQIFTPGRNSLLLAIAACIAEVTEAEFITFGANQSERGYADNTKDFLDAFTKVLEYSCLKIHPKVISPIWEMDKVEIYKWMFDNGFGWVTDYTWPCDNEPIKISDPVIDRDDLIPCANCGCCRNRQMVFHILEKMYPGQYKDGQVYYESKWFVDALLPTLRQRGIPDRKWFKKYEGLICG